MTILGMVMKEEVGESLIKVLRHLALIVHQIIGVTQIRETDAHRLINVHHIGDVTPAVTVVHQAVRVNSIVVVMGNHILVIIVPHQSERAVLFQQSPHTAAAGAAVQPDHQGNVRPSIAVISTPLITRMSSLRVKARFDEPIK